MIWDAYCVLWNVLFWLSSMVEQNALPNALEGHWYPYRQLCIIPTGRNMFKQGALPDTWLDKPTLQHAMKELSEAQQSACTSRCWKCAASRWPWCKLFIMRMNDVASEEMKMKFIPARSSGAKSGQLQHLAH